MGGGTSAASEPSMIAIGDGSGASSGGRITRSSRCQDTARIVVPVPPGTSAPMKISSSPCTSGSGASASNVSCG
jgi:hypothetical protein